MKHFAVLFLMCVGFLLQSCGKDDSAPSPKENILYQTDFSQDDGKWWVGSNSYSSGSYNNGQYWLKVTSSKARIVHIGNVLLETTGTTALETSIKAEYINSQTTYGVGGIIFHYKENSSNFSGTTFIISYDGYWTLVRFDSATGNWTPYLDWTPSSSIRKNDFNKLRIERASDKIRFYINGTEVYSMASTADFTSGGVGLFANSYSIIKADYFKAVELK